MNGVLLIVKRFASKGSRFKESTPCDFALKHFDDFYKAVFGEKWPSVRLGLLSRQRYLALINNFGEVEETEKLFQSLGAFDLRSFLEVQKGFDFDPGRKVRRIIDLGDVISQQVEVEEEKESELHPEGLEFKKRVDAFRKEEEEGEEEYVYHPDDARTSLNSDLTKSEIDTSRLILPNSKGDLKLQEYVPVTQLRGAESYVAESEYYKYYKVKSKVGYNIEEERELDFPENLKVYSFDRGDVSEFPEPVRNVANVHNFLKMDGSDLLAAIVLGVQKNETVLDLCSTSPSIAYSLFQSLRPGFLLCTSTNGDTEELFQDHLIDFSSSWGDMLHLTKESVDEVVNEILFDKVLVDVPSTNDRAALFEEDDNIFHAADVKERLKLPEHQCEYLKKGLTLVRPGGAVVYTTSALSPVQNEGVVGEALKSLWEERRMEFTIRDLTPALRHTSTIFNFGDYLNLKFGTLVVPYTPVNFGPRYICKIVRNKEAVEKTPLFSLTTSTAAEVDVTLILQEIHRKMDQDVQTSPLNLLKNLHPETAQFRLLPGSWKFSPMKGFISHQQSWNFFRNKIINK